MPFFFIDYWYLVLVVPTLLVTVWAQIRVKSTFHKYDKYRSARGLTADMVARQILDQNGLYHVPVEFVPGELSDHYEPRSQVVRLSKSTYGNPSVSAIGIAAHEVGHAVQYAQGYFPIRLRAAILPVCNIGSTLAIPLVIAGLILSFQPLVTFGILLFALVVLFQLVTLPVEYNASRRAVQTLEQNYILEGEEVQEAKKVLSAAALTYVAALLVSIANLLRLILLSNNRRR